MEGEHRYAQSCCANESKRQVDQSLQYLHDFLFRSLEKLRTKEEEARKEKDGNGHGKSRRRDAKRVGSCASPQRRSSGSCLQHKEKDLYKNHKKGRF